MKWANDAVVITCVLLWLGTPVSAENWPQFRGPTGLGYSAEHNLPVTWGGAEGSNILWKSPLKGQGHASPIVWENRVFVCTVAWAPNVTREKIIPDHHVTCYNASTGDVIWDRIVPPGPWLRTDFRSGPGGGYAAPTPATDGRLVYCAFGSSVLAALDFDGRIAWRKEIIPYTFDVTVASSPIPYRDTLIFLCAMAKPADSKVIAFDKATGRVKWEQKLAGTGFGHSTPLIINAGGREQMLILASGMGVTGSALLSLDPTDGRRLWFCRGAGDVPTPAYGDGIVYFDSGRGGPGFAVDPTGSGDVSGTHMKWTVPQIPEGLSSPIIVGKFVYRLHTPGVLKCWDTHSGKEVFSKRLEGITSTWASPIADVDGRIFFASAGKSYVIQGGGEPKVLASNDLGDPNHASAAVSGGRMYLVGQKNIFCIGAK